MTAGKINQTMFIFTLCAWFSLVYCVQARAILNFSRILFVLRDSWILYVLHILGKRVTIPYVSYNYLSSMHIIIQIFVDQQPSAEHSNAKQTAVFEVQDLDGFGSILGVLQTCSIDVCLLAFIVCNTEHKLVAISDELVADPTAGYSTI
jgi:hypothetical protein